MQALLLDSLPRLLRGPRAAHWAKLLGRADALPEDPPGLSAQLAPSVGLAPRALPWSALLAHDAGIEVGAARWLALEALSLKVSPNGLYVVASGDFGQGTEAMQALWESASTTLAVAGLVLEPQAKIRAFAQLPDACSDPDSDPAEDLLGVELQAHLPSDRSWRRVLGELQIEWTQHPVNSARLGRGELPINSAWFGRASQWSAAPTTLESAYSQDPLVAAFGRWAGARGVGAPGPQTTLVDGRGEQDAVLNWLRGITGPCALRFACGRRFVFRYRQRLRFWRPLLTLPDDNSPAQRP